MISVGRWRASSPRPAANLSVPAGPSAAMFVSTLIRRARPSPVRFTSTIRTPGPASWLSRRIAKAVPPPPEAAVRPAGPARRHSCSRTAATRALTTNPLKCSQKTCHAIAAAFSNACTSSSRLARRATSMPTGNAREPSGQPPSRVARGTATCDDNGYFRNARRRDAWKLEMIPGERRPERACAILTLADAPRCEERDRRKVGDRWQCIKSVAACEVERDGKCYAATDEGPALRAKPAADR